jgi:hypothetical protein
LALFKNLIAEIAISKETSEFILCLTSTENSEPGRTQIPENPESGPTRILENQKNIIPLSAIS